MLQPGPQSASSPGHRSAADGDHDFIHRLVEMTERSQLERLRGWNEADERVRVDRMIARSKVHILTRGTVPVGVLALETSADALMLNLLRVLPIWQRRGYGAAALSAVLERADSAGLPVVTTLYTIDPAVEFYRRFGFTPERDSMLTYTLMRWPRP